MARSHLVACKRGLNGYVMGRDDTNSILDTRLYQEEFSGGKVAVLTIKIIAKSMFTNYDAEGNEHLLLDLLIYHKKYCKEISLAGQDMYI